jgi:predicted nucleic acid-binding protein
MRRVVVDTNVYIDWFNAGRHEDVLLQRDAVKHLSAVVLMELRAGAFTARDRRLVQRVESAFLRGAIAPPSLVPLVKSDLKKRSRRSRRG